MHGDKGGFYAEAAFAKGFSGVRWPTHAAKGKESILCGGKIHSDSPNVGCR